MFILLYKQNKVVRLGEGEKYGILNGRPRRKSCTYFHYSRSKRAFIQTTSQPLCNVIQHLDRPLYSAHCRPFYDKGNPDHAKICTNPPISTARSSANIHSNQAETHARNCCAYLSYIATASVSSAHLSSPCAKHCTTIYNVAYIIVFILIYASSIC
jgi:hypothetical protein